MPGKFASELDERVYEVSLDGSCEEFGDVQFGGHFTLVEDFEGYDWIVQEDSQGFIDVDRYPLGTHAEDVFRTQEWEYYRDDTDEDESEPEVSCCPQCGSMEHTSVLVCDLRQAEDLLDRTP